MPYITSYLCDRICSSFYDNHRYYYLFVEAESEYSASNVKRREVKLIFDPTLVVEKMLTNQTRIKNSIRKMLLCNSFGSSWWDPLKCNYYFYGALHFQVVLISKFNGLVSNYAKVAVSALVSFSNYSRVIFKLITSLKTSSLLFAFKIYIAVNNFSPLKFIPAVHFLIIVV